MTSLTLDFAQMFAPPAPTDAESDLTCLLATCPAPHSESDWEWEAEREEEAWRVHFEREAAEAARRDDRLSQECPWLRFSDAYDGEEG